MRDELAEASRKLSDQAVSDCDAGMAFAFRDAARVWELIGKRQRGEPLTESDRTEAIRLCKEMAKYREQEGGRDDK